MRHVCAVAVSLIFVAAAAAFAQAPSTAAASGGVLNPGKWEITIQTETPFVAPPVTVTVCIPKGDAERPQPPKGKPSDDCQISGDGLLGNVLAYTAKCLKKNVTTNARFTYAGDRYDGVVTVKTGGQEVRQVYTAKRIGECEPRETQQP